MPRADLAIVSFHEHLGTEDVSFAGTARVGDLSSEQEFVVDGVPFGRGYLVMQLAFAQEANPAVLINGTRVDGEAAAHAVATGMVVFPDGVLKRGPNTIQIQRIDGGEDFAIYDVVIHWREKEPMRDALRAIVESIAADKK
jgi:hypothetical protein